MNNLTERERIALELLKEETKNVWTWANRSEADKIAYCFKMADQFLAACKAKVA